MEVFGILGILIWIGLSFLVANAARNRNRSYAGALILSLLTSPLIAWLIVVLMGHKRD